MIGLLIRVAVLLGSSTIGLVAASLLLPDFHLSASGFIVTVAVFTVAQAVLAPFIFSVARKHASALLGGIGLVSTLVALIIASLTPGGIQIDGITTWVTASLVVWLATALGGWLLPLVAVKRRVSGSGPSAGPGAVH